MTFTGREFTARGTVTDATLTYLDGIDASALGEIYRQFGTGFVGGGFVRLIDPAYVLPSLDELFSSSTSVLPFGATGLGDLIVLRPHSIDVAQLRRGRVVSFKPHIEEFLKACTFQTFEAVHLGSTEYYQLEDPTDLLEAHFATPLEILGGHGSRDTFRKADTVLTWKIACNLAGPCQLPDPASQP